MNNQLLLKEYGKKLTRLRQGVTAYGKAPHKPVLLLAMLDGVDQGHFGKTRVVFISFSSMKDALLGR